MYHVPVLLNEVLEEAQIKSGDKVIDCTFGGGGHSNAFLKLGAQVLGIDQDQDAINHAQELLAQYPKLQLVHTNFSNLQKTADEKGFNNANAILADLGVSSWQFDQGSRGFSFQHEAELDMRMDNTLGVTAKDLLAALGHKELTKLFQLYGGESKARQIAEAIVIERNRNPILTTTQLSQLVEKVYRHQRGKLHPATKVFQALRIAVNDEINVLKNLLPQAIECLKPGGRLLIISFHEGEDRVVKHFLREQEILGKVDVVTKSPIGPTSEEIAANIRSRSAKLRVAMKV